MICRFFGAIIVTRDSGSDDAMISFACDDTEHKRIRLDAMRTVSGYLVDWFRMTLTPGYLFHRGLTDTVTSAAEDPAECRKRQGRKKP
jgi:hypothetical protein